MCGCPSAFQHLRTIQRTHLVSAVIEQKHIVSINYRTDRSLFDLQKLKAKIKISRTSLLELQYPDDCAIVADSTESTQLDHMSELYRRLGLSINVQKTDYHQSISQPQVSTSTFNIDGSTLKKFDCFRYLGSNISAKCCLDDEINFRICQATGAFGRLSSRVFMNHNFRLRAKISVYHAVVISALLYGSETWTLYRKQITTLEKFRMNSLH